MINNTGRNAISKLTDNTLTATQNPRLNNLPTKLLSKSLIAALAYYHNMPINKFGAMIEPIFEVNGTQKAERLIETSNITIETNGLENIDTSKPCILAIIHPTGTMDGSLAMLEAQQRRGGVRMMATTKVYAFDPNPPRMIPVNTLAKKGEKVEESVLDTKILEAKDQNIPIVIAPSGDYAHLDENGNVVDGKRNRRVIKIAEQYGLPIIPMHIQANAPKKFYNLAHSGTINSIKAMMIGMLAQQGQTITITYGQEFTDISYSSLAELSEKTQQLKDITHGLNTNNIYS